MVSPTRSSRAARFQRGSARNGHARTSVLLGLGAVLVEPAALLLARLTSVSLVQAGLAAPVAAALGASAVIAARRARRLSERTLGRVGGSGAARSGRWLGVVGLCLAAAAGIAVGFYGLLTVFEH